MDFGTIYPHIVNNRTKGDWILGEFQYFEKGQLALGRNWEFSLTNGDYFGEKSAFRRQIATIRYNNGKSPLFFGGKIRL